MMEALKKAKKIAHLLQKESDDPLYLRQVLKHLKKELRLPPLLQTETTPYIPTDEEIKKYYDTVWKSQKMTHVVLIKTFLYTGIKVSELIDIRLDHIDLENCRIKIKGKKPRLVPFPKYFREVLALHMQAMRQKRATYLFESTHKKPYSDRGIRKVLEIYTEKAGIEERMSPNTLRHFLFKWMQKQGIEESFTQTYSGHANPQFLNIYKSLPEGQNVYDKVIDKFPV